jgi:S-adenosylmethionine hydrolase
VISNISTTKIENPSSDAPKLNIANNSLPKTDSKKGIIIIDKYGNHKWSKGNDNADTTIIGTLVMFFN